MRHRILFFFLAFIGISQFVTSSDVRNKYNFNSDWLLNVGDVPEAKQPRFSDSEWKKVTLPHAFNEDEAFRLSIDELTDTIMWYRKHFRLPADSKNKKVFVEFEGVRQGADFYINGQNVGLHENGVMAVGFDLTPYIKYGQENVIAVRIDNDWNYKERATGTKYQWSNKNFNANYGGIPKNVWLHVTDRLYQTLPLYSNLKTTGVYIYAEDIRVKSRKAIIHAESEIRNEYNRDKHVSYQVELIDRDGTSVQTFEGTKAVVKPGETITLKAASEVDNLHFWSWGYGYLYTVKTSLWVDGRKVDEVATRTGFRKTRFGKGMIWLNDRVIQMKGFAQRTSNEWPGVGMSVPAWLSDYSNHLMVEGNANLVRWMHVTPWKQDIESCDRVGLIQAMQAGDAEKDCEGRQWEQRTELMRDAIIYNRNNPSIIFYECGNESISREHMIEMKAIRDLYDPHGGRAIGSREMLDIREAEYGGEMLYINKSAHHPMWAMEYCRDEGLRKYWDDYSYPYHKDGDGSNSYKSTVTNKVQKKVDARVYNRNQDSFTIENIIRWFDYWRERPGTGDRVSSGGVKIIFSDTNTHYRGVENYRRSGVTDAMRIPKDPFFAHQVMWDGWVDTECPRIYIVGHWNYNDTVVKPVYVVSSADKVELFLNGKSLGYGERDYHFLYTFKDIAFVPGKLEAVGYDENGKECCRTQLQTAGKPEQIQLSFIQSPEGWKADGAVDALAGADLLLDALGGDDVGVNTHTDGKDDARDARQRQREAVEHREIAGYECERHGRLPQQRNNRHRAGQTVIRNHEQRHQHERDHACDHHGLQRVCSQAGADRAVILGRKRKRQRAGIDLVCQRDGFVARLVIRTVQCDHGVSVRDCRVNGGIRDHRVVHPDRDGSLGLRKARGGLGKALFAGIVEFQRNIILAVCSAVRIVVHGSGRAFDVLALKDDVLRRHTCGLALAVHFFTLAEREHRSGADLLDRGLGVEIRLTFLPRETNDDTVLIVIRIHFVVRDVQVHKALLDDGLRRGHLLVRCVVAVGRHERHVHAASDVDAEADVLRALHPNFCCVAILRADAQERGKREHDDQDRNNKKLPGFPFCLHGVPPEMKLSILPRRGAQAQSAGTSLPLQ